MATEQMIPIPAKSGIFISHIAEESALAVLLQAYIRRAFNDNVEVFVSTDKRSIGGGKEWWELIRQKLKGFRVVLVLLSDESVSQPWINYEAGVGDGAGFLPEACTRVIPLAVKSFHFGKLGFPLRGFNGRELLDLEGILYDISQETGLVSVRVDSAQFAEDLKKAEASLIYKNLVMRPILDKSRYWLLFEMANLGNTDIGLLYAETILPMAIKSPNWNPQNYPNALDVERVEDPPNYFCFRYWNHAGDKIPRLPPVLTRSMKTVQLPYLRYVLKEPCNAEESALKIYYQIYAQDYDTDQQSVTLAELINA